jgi:hypothetical protein
VKIDEDKPGLIPSKYIIPPVADPMKDFNILQIVRAKFPVYLDENRPSLLVPAPSDIVAESICRDFKVGTAHYEPTVSEPGLFWQRGQWSKAEVDSKLGKEIAIARTMQVEWFKRLVDSADDDWGRYRMRRMISGLQRTACNILKLERDWNMETEIRENLAMGPCKFCHADIHMDSIVCRYCQGILNMARYKTEFVKAGSLPADVQTALSK